MPKDVCMIMHGCEEVGMSVEYPFTQRGSHMDAPRQRGTVVNSQEDVREVPNYSVTEAARCLQLPRTTLRQWAAGRRDPHDAPEWIFEPLLHPASRSPLLLSLTNVLEAPGLSALRREPQDRLAKIRVRLG